MIPHALPKEYVRATGDEILDLIHRKLKDKLMAIVTSDHAPRSIQQVDDPYTKLALTSDLPPIALLRTTAESTIPYESIILASWQRTMISAFTILNTQCEEATSIALDNATEAVFGESYDDRRILWQMSNLLSERSQLRGFNEAFYAYFMRELCTHLGEPNEPRFVVLQGKRFQTTPSKSASHTQLYEHIKKAGRYSPPQWATSDVASIKEGRVLIMCRESPTNYPVNERTLIYVHEDSLLCDVYPVGSQIHNFFARAFDYLCQTFLQDSIVNVPRYVIHAENVIPRDKCVKDLFIDKWIEHVFMAMMAAHSSAIDRYIDHTNTVFQLDDFINLDTRIYHVLSAARTAFQTYVSPRPIEQVLEMKRVILERYVNGTAAISTRQVVNSRLPELP